MSIIDTSSWNPDPALNESIGDIPLNESASIKQTWQVIQMLMAGLKGDTGTLETNVEGKADDSAVVHLIGAETITGAKTFSSTIVGSISGNAGTVSGHTVGTDVPASAVFTDTTYGEATATAAGLMSAADKSKLDGLGSVFAFRGSVATVSALPSSGNTAGDVYAVESPVSVYAWSGSAWVQISDDFAPMTSAQVEAIFGE